MSSVSVTITVTLGQQKGLGSIAAMQKVYSASKTTKENFNTSFAKEVMFTS